MSDDARRSISSLEALEARLVFIGFDNADVWRLSKGDDGGGAEGSLPVTIDIRRQGQHLSHDVRTTTAG